MVRDFLRGHCSDCEACLIFFSKGPKGRNLISFSESGILVLLFLLHADGDNGDDNDDDGQMKLFGKGRLSWQAGWNSDSAAARWHLYHNPEKLSGHPENDVDDDDDDSDDGNGDFW